MAKKSRFSIEGIEVIMKDLEKREAEMEKRMEQILIRVAEKIIHDAKQLAPLDSGELEASLHVGEVVKELKRMHIPFGNSPETDHYAVVQHEGFRKTKSGKVVYMTPGPKTMSKPSYKGYEPGKKYLENAIKLNEGLIIEELRKALSFK